MARKSGGQEVKKSGSNEDSFAPHVPVVLLLQAVKRVPCPLSVFIRGFDFFALRKFLNVALGGRT
jgi:hypothetical protein